MTDNIEEWVDEIHQGDAAETLAEMPDDSVHMAMSSPPYFGLRDYDVEGQIGLEETLDDYIDEILAVGDELQDVLRDDGSWWLNIGDTYSGGGGMSGVPEDHDSKSTNHSKGEQPDDPPARDTRFGSKNKMLVPHRTAIALQESGWIVRNDVVWQKPNPMPESVTDRLSKTFEFIFHLTLQPDYWYDLDAIREPHKEASIARRGREDSTRGGVDVTGLSEHTGIGDGDLHPSGKNPGDVFEVTTKPFPEAHFAVFPPELCEKPVKATCPPRVCAECGTPYEREVDVTELERPRDVDVEEHDSQERTHRSKWVGTPKYRETTGWLQKCDCSTGEYEPGIALDPFVGAGTLPVVAQDHRRRYIGIDLNPDYVAMAQARLDDPVDEPERLDDTGFSPKYVEDPSEW